MISITTEGSPKNTRVYYKSRLLKCVKGVKLITHVNGIYKIQLKVDRNWARKDESFTELLLDSPDYIEILYAS